MGRVEQVRLVVVRRLELGSLHLRWLRNPELDAETGAPFNTGAAAARKRDGFVIAGRGIVGYVTKLLKRKHNLRF